LTFDELRALNVVFDRAIAESVARHVEARDRTLAAIDAISRASLEATSLPDLLQRLLTVHEPCDPSQGRPRAVRPGAEPVGGRAHLSMVRAWREPRS
jgi:hypothetical protein